MREWQEAEDTHIDGIPLEYAQLQEELQLDLALLEELLHLGLGLVQLLQHRLDVADGAVVGGLIAGDGRVPAERQKGTGTGMRKSPTVRHQIRPAAQTSGGRELAGSGAAGLRKWNQQPLPPHNPGLPPPSKLPGLRPH